MSIASILLLLQVAVSLLVNIQTNPNATPTQKSQALSFANQAISISANYISQTSSAGATPVKSSPATTPAAGAQSGSTAQTATPTPAATTPPQNNGAIFATPLGSTTNRAKTNVDDIAVLNLRASSFGGISLVSLKLTFSGTLTSSTFGNADVKLVNSSNVPVGSLAPVTCNTGPTCTFTWTNFGSDGIISPDSSLALKLRIDSLTNAVTGSGGVSNTFSAVIQSAADLTYNDTVDSSGATVSLPITAVPLVLNSVSYAPGT